MLLTCILSYSLFVCPYRACVLPSGNIQRDSGTDESPHDDESNTTDVPWNTPIAIRTTPAAIELLSTAPPHPEIPVTLRAPTTVCAPSSAEIVLDRRMIEWVTTVRYHTTLGI